MTRIDGNWAACNAHEAAECEDQERYERIGDYVDKYIEPLGKYLKVIIGNETSLVECVAIANRVTEFFGRVEFEVTEDGFGGACWKYTFRFIERGERDVDAVESAIDKLMAAPLSVEQWGLRELIIEQLED